MRIARGVGVGCFLFNEAAAASHRPKTASQKTAAKEVYIGYCARFLENNLRFRIHMVKELPDDEVERARVLKRREEDKLRKREIVDKAFRKRMLKIKVVPRRRKQPLKERAVFKPKDAENYTHGERLRDHDANPNPA